MFKSLDSETATGPCPYCTKDSFKFKLKDVWMFLCHNCQRYMRFDRTGIQEEVQVNSISNFNALLSFIQRVDSLPNENRFRKYCENRRIPLDRVYYTDQFYKLSEYAKTPVSKDDNERIVLPLFKEDGTLFGMQGRALEKEKIRYITLMFDKDQPKLFGLEKINKDETITIVEGPIDSLFVKNCIAMAGSDASLNKYKTNSIICLDNEPRNPQIVQKMSKFIDNGFKVVIWPEHIKEKDINDMILSGIEPNSIIQNHSYSGLTGKIKLNTWKKTRTL